MSIPSSGKNDTFPPKKSSDLHPVTLDLTSLLDTESKDASPITQTKQIPQTSSSVNLSHIHAATSKTHSNIAKPPALSAAETKAAKLVGYPGWSYFVKLHQAARLLFCLCLIHIGRLVYPLYLDISHAAVVPLFNRDGSLIDMPPPRSIFSLHSLFPLLTIILCTYLYIIIPNVVTYVQKHDRRHISREVPPPPPVLHMTFELLMLVLIHLCDFASIPFLEFPYALHLYNVLILVTSGNGGRDNGYEFFRDSSSANATTAAAAGTAASAVQYNVTWDAVQPILLYSFVQFAIILAITTQLCIIVLMLLDIRRIYQCQIWWDRYIKNFQTKQRAFVVGSYNQVNRFNRFAILADDQYDYIGEPIGESIRGDDDDRDDSLVDRFTDEERVKRKRLKYEKQKQYIKMLQRKYHQQVKVQREFDLQELQARQREQQQESHAKFSSQQLTLGPKSPLHQGTDADELHISPALDRSQQSQSHRAGFIDDIEQVDTTLPHGDESQGNDAASNDGSRDTPSSHSAKTSSRLTENDSTDDEEDPDQQDLEGSSLLGHSSTHIDRVPCIMLPPYVVPPGMMHPRIRPFATKFYSLIVRGITELISTSSSKSSTSSSSSASSASPRGQRFTYDDIYPS